MIPVDGIHLVDKRSQLEMFFEYTDGFDWYASYQLFQNEEFDSTTNKISENDSHELRLGIRVLITKSL